jgi:hypothetical protein
VTLDDPAHPPGIEQVGEALRRILRLDQIGVVADGAEQGEHGCVHAIRIDLLGRQVLGYVLWHVRREQAVALPMDKMCCVCAADDIDFVEPDLLFFADALEHALCSGSLHADGDAGVLGLERLAEFFRDRNLHSGVERDHGFLPGGLDHGRADGNWLRRSGLERLWKDGANGQHRRCLEHVASAKLPISHGFRSLTAVARERPWFMHQPA